MFSSVNNAFNYINTNYFNFTELKCKVSEVYEEKKLKYAYLAVPTVAALHGLVSVVYDLTYGPVVASLAISGTALAATHLFLAVKHRLDIHDICKRGDTAMAKALIEANPKLIYEQDSVIIGHNLLETAISWQNKKVVKLILKLDSSLANVPSLSNVLPLHLALSYDDNDAVIKLVLEHTRDIDADDLNNRTPLEIACQRGYFEIAKLLIKKGAQVDKKISGMQLLKYMIGVDDIKAVTMLIDYGANVNLKDDLGETPLHSACSLDKAAIAQILIEHGARLDIKNRTGQTPRDVAGPNTLVLLNQLADQTESSEFGFE